MWIGLDDLIPGSHRWQSGLYPINDKFSKIQNKTGQNNDDGIAIRKNKKGNWVWKHRDRNADKAYVCVHQLPQEYENGKYQPADH